MAFLNASVTALGLDAPFFSYYERRFDITEFQKWLALNWKFPFLSSLTYVILVHSGQQWMKYRPRYELRIPLILWNLGLSLFSIAGALKTLNDYWGEYQSLHYSICDNKAWVYNKVSPLWIALFLFSKVVEFGDTAFIILRKQPLIFLHWYHHITVLIYTWISYQELHSTGRLFALMNYSVHSLMYTYYLIKAMRIKLPTPVAMLVTATQLSQMAFGVFINLYALNVKNSGRECDITYRHIGLSFAMYFSYLVLFGIFFYRTYFARRGGARSSGKVPSKLKENGLPVANGIGRSAVTTNDKKHL